MNIYLLQNETSKRLYGVYNSAVVYAKDENQARLIHPSGYDWHKDNRHFTESWSTPEMVKVIYIGLAFDGAIPGVVCASYIGE